MKPELPLVFYHAPNTRSTGVLLLLEELGATYSLQPLNVRRGEHKAQAYLDVNPLGKVPAIRHGTALVTEQVAIYIYLADLFPVAGLAPRIGDPLRGPYLRWLAFYGSCFEPAIIDRQQKREPAPPSMSPYGSFESMFAALTDQLRQGDCMLGERFYALDVLWGTALSWMLSFGLVPKVPLLVNYVARVNARPAIIRGREKDAALAGAQSPPA
jgi:glutathione S-transferase